MNLQQAWYAKKVSLPIWIWLIAPFTLLFWCITRVRRALFALKVLPQYQSRLPVIVVGNISVGGNGKTPVVLALIHYLKEKGITCAVLSRGYGASQRDFPHLLAANSAASLVGDEPALISQRMDIPVVIDPKRARGARYIEQQTDAQVIICDDGLQHYALARDIELCVMDKRGLGNGFLLPMGPLRESKARLKNIDWLIYNGNDVQQQSSLQGLDTAIAVMTLSPSAWINVHNGNKLALEEGAAYFNACSSVAAIAAIGDPKRFFTTLRDLDINVIVSKALPDHHDIAQDDIPQANIVLMTEKDAVKCKNLPCENYWYLQVEALLPEVFYQDVQQRLRQLIG